MDDPVEAGFATLLIIFFLKRKLKAVAYHSYKLYAEFHISSFISVLTVNLQTTKEYIVKNTKSAITQ